MLDFNIPSEDYIKLPLVFAGMGFWGSVSPMSTVMNPLLFAAAATLPAYYLFRKLEQTLTNPYADPDLHHIGASEVNQQLPPQRY